MSRNTSLKIVIISLVLVALIPIWLDKFYIYPKKSYQLTPVNTISGELDNNKKQEETHEIVKDQIPENTEESTLKKEEKTEETTSPSHSTKSSDVNNIDLASYMKLMKLSEDINNAIENNKVEVISSKLLLMKDSVIIKNNTELLDEIDAIIKKLDHILEIKSQKFSEFNYIFGKFFRINYIPKEELKEISAKLDDIILKIKNIELNNIN